MIERVKKYIRENHMLKAGDMVAAGVSGGCSAIFARAIWRFRPRFGRLHERELPRQLASILSLVSDCPWTIS